MIWLLVATAAAGGLAAFLGLRHSWRELGRIEREHQQVLHQDHIERQGDTP